jgi:hypothetical protein
MLSIFPPWENFIPNVGKFHSQRGKMNNLRRELLAAPWQSYNPSEKTSKISHFFAVFAPNLSLLRPICSA